MNRWLDGRIEWWMDGGTDGQNDGWIEWWMDERMEWWGDVMMVGWKDRMMDGWTDGRIEWWVDGMMDGCVDGWIDRMMYDGQKEWWLDGWIERWMDRLYNWNGHSLAQTWPVASTAIIITWLVWPNNNYSKGTKVLLLSFFASSCNTIEKNSLSKNVEFLSSHSSTQKSLKNVGNQTALLPFDFIVFFVQMGSKTVP